MKLSLSIPLYYFAFLFLISFSSARELEARRKGGQTDIQVNRSQSLGTRSVRNVPTSTKTKVIHKPARTVTSIRTPKVTVTPQRVTVFKTRNSFVTVTVTDEAVTDTFSTTSTELETSTITEVQVVPTTVEVTETTTLTPTSTIAAPASFTPAALTKNKRVSRRDLIAKDSDEMDLFSRGKKDGLVGMGGRAPPRLYPQSVECLKKKVIYPPRQTVTKFSKKTQTITARPATRTSTTTLTSTTTSTVVPDGVSVTESFTVTDTVTETSTTTSATTITTTSTATAFAPERTIYAACGPDNLITKGRNDVPIRSLIISYDDESLSISNIAFDGLSPVDCCAECQARPNCLGNNHNSFRSGVCYILLGSDKAICPADGSAFTSQFAFYRTTGQDENTRTLSNGQCHALYDGTP